MQKERQTDSELFVWRSNTRLVCDSTFWCAVDVLCLNDAFYLGKWLLDRLAGGGVLNKQVGVFVLMFP